MRMPRHSELIMKKSSGIHCNDFSAHIENPHRIIEWQQLVGWIFWLSRKRKTADRCYIIIESQWWEYRLIFYLCLSIKLNGRMSELRKKFALRCCDSYRFSLAFNWFPLDEIISCKRRICACLIFKSYRYFFERTFSKPITQVLSLKMEPINLKFHFHLSTTWAHICIFIPYHSN